MALAHWERIIGFGITEIFRTSRTDHQTRGMEHRSGFKPFLRYGSYHTVFFRLKNILDLVSGCENNWSILKIIIFLVNLKTMTIYRIYFYYIFACFHCLDRQQHLERKAWDSLDVPSRIVNDFKLLKVKVGDEKYSNQCKKITIQSIEIISADDESLTLMSDQIIPSGMQDSGFAENNFL